MNGRFRGIELEVLDICCVSEAAARLLFGSKKIDSEHFIVIIFKMQSFRYMIQGHRN